MKTSRVAAVMVLGIYLAAGCGGGSTPDGKAAPGAVVAAPAGATISGKVTFSGTAPKPTPIKMNADPICIQNHKGVAQTEAVVVNGNGTLKNVFVYVKGDVAGAPKAPAEPVVMDQKGCQYLPHVFGIQAGQPLKVLNDDGTLHNVHAITKVNTSFNLAMPKFMKEKTVKFDKPEQMVKFQCEVHNWMNAWAGVMSHPYFAVTGDDGSFSLKGLPPGTYDIVAWHEKYGIQTSKVTVAGSETKTQDFAFKAS